MKKKTMESSCSPHADKDGPAPDHPKNPSSSFRLRVYYEDTDAGGVVYHASYLRFAERARTEWLRACGTDHLTLRERDNALFVVRKLTIEYDAPGRLDDELKIMTTIEKIGGASLDMKQIILQEGSQKVLAKLDIRLVMVSFEGTVIRIPAWLRKKFEDLQETRS